MLTEPLTSALVAVIVYSLLDTGALAATSKISSAALPPAGIVSAPATVTPLGSPETARLTASSAPLKRSTPTPTSALWLCAAEENPPASRLIAGGGGVLGTSKLRLSISKRLADGDRALHGEVGDLFV